jgi:hypothetical protein
LEKEISRIHRLALPLIIKRKDTALHISDGFFGHDFEFKDFDQLKVTGVDGDGFVTFEISMPRQQTLAFGESPQRSRLFASGSFSLLGSGSAKTSGSGITRGTYEYFKRSTDEYYYASHKMDGKEDKRIHLGSLRDPTSHIHQIIKACQRFDEEAWFDRKRLSEYLTKAQRHGQKLKSALDIMVIEGFLERKESLSKKSKAYELYHATPKLRALK